MSSKLTEYGKRLIIKEYLKMAELTFELGPDEVAEALVRAIEIKMGCPPGALCCRVLELDGANYAQTHEIMTITVQAKPK